ncbi:MAG: efflux RND transporter permease subunit, partial [Clostridia bacterium]|nr:efflux RND transporter permease subunit [Clostridia bacterium]
MKKIFAFFISFALIIGFMPFIESPAKAYNYGDPVETAQDLCDLRDYLNSNPAMQNSVITFKNNAVIDLTGINWEPILYFNGHIFGNGATIRGLYIDPYDGETNGGWQHFGGLNNVGFISVMEHTEVENLNIEVDHIEGHHLVGALCGQAMSSYIHDCTVGAVNDKWMLDEGIITGICGVGGFAGGFANGASDPYTDNDLYGNSTEGVIADCVTLYPLQIFTSNEYSSDQAVPYSSSLNRNADYKNAPDYICANTSVGSIYDYPPYDSATGKRLEEGFFAGGFVGLAWESPCNYFNCVNNAFVSASIGGAGGIIGHTVNGAIIRQCSNTGYILGSDRGACMFTLEHEEYFGDNQYLRLMPFKSLRHPDTFTSYYECNEGIAGIVGISGAGTLIEDCANEGPIEGQKELGGIAGIVLEAFSTSDSCLNTRITDSYNAGALFTKDTLIIGGIAGYVAPFSTVYTPQGGSSCPYCSGGSSQNSPSGYCDNIIENCFNIGGVLASVTIGGPLIQRYPDNVNSATNSTFFYGGIVGTIYMQFAVTMCVALCISAVNALTLSPALCALILRRVDPNRKKNLFFRTFDRVLDRIKDGYLAFSRFMIRRAFLTVILLLLVLGAFFYLIWSAPGGFLPDEDKGSLLCEIELPQGAALERTDRAMKEFNDYALKVSGVEKVITVAGFSIMS